MNKDKKATTKPEKIKITSDALFKKLITNEIAAREFLQEYLPEKLLERLDLSHIVVEPESFVDEALNRRLSDIIYQLKEKNGDSAYVYVLLEQQSKSDRQMPLRLMRYSLLLMERLLAKNKKQKLPLIAPIVFYNGRAKYTAPRSLWEMFAEPAQAKELLGDEYMLVDLQSMDEASILKKKHLGLMEFFMKHIHMRDMLKLWQQAMPKVRDLISYDRDSGFLYIRSLLWYTEAKVDFGQKDELNEIILAGLNEEEGEELMPTIAEHYYNNGIEKGLSQGLSQGIEKGRLEGRQEAASRMLSKGFAADVVADTLSLPLEVVLELKKRT